MGNSEGLLAESWMIPRDRIGCDVDGADSAAERTLGGSAVTTCHHKRFCALRCIAVHLRCTPGRTRCGLAGDANAMRVSDEMTTDQAAC
jgi:hypothetical protein